MLTPKQNEILKFLSEQPDLPAKELQNKLAVSRARLNQLVAPLVKQKIVKRKGWARATVYQQTDKRPIEQIRRENWQLRQKILELGKQLDSRKIIERAKEILIAQFDIVPTEAYRKLQEQSMDRNRSMREMAEAIIAAYE